MFGLSFPGPFAVFPKTLQTGVIELLYHMDEITPALYNAIALCCHLEGVDADVVALALRVTTMRIVDRDAPGSPRRVAQIAVRVALPWDWTVFT